MAYWDGGSGTGEGGRIPPTVSVRQLPTPHSQLSAYDTEEHVVYEAESVTRNFIYESYQLEMSANVPSSITTLIPELRNVTLDPTRYVKIIEQLAFPLATVKFDTCLSLAFFGYSMHACVYIVNRSFFQFKLILNLSF